MEKEEAATQSNCATRSSAVKASPREKGRSRERKAQTSKEQQQTADLPEARCAASSLVDGKSNPKKRAPKSSQLENPKHLKSESMRQAFQGEERPSGQAKPLFEGDRTSHRTSDTRNPVNSIGSSCTDDLLDSRQKLK